MTHIFVKQVVKELGSDGRGCECESLVWEGAGICGFGMNQRSLLSFPTAHE